MQRIIYGFLRYVDKNKNNKSNWINKGKNVNTTSAITTNVFALVKFSFDYVLSFHSLFYILILTSFDLSSFFLISSVLVFSLFVSYLAVVKAQNELENVLAERES